MSSSQKPSTFWVGWLTLTTAGVLVFGVILTLFPGLTREGFSLLLYADTQRLTSFGSDAVQYIELLHAVLGGVMVGWAAALLIVVRRLYARGERLGWEIIAVSLVVWFVPDTSYSLWSGFWQNAMLNLTLLVLFLIPLIATFRIFHDSRT